MYKKYLLLIFIGVIQNAHGLKLNRVILSTDNNPNYIQFWPIVAKAWKEIVGITPTLALVADDDVKVDENLGDIIRFKPIEGIPTSLQAQTIRLLLPTLFPDDVCILSDIDMIPLCKDYFVDSVKSFPDDSFVVYQSAHYGLKATRWPICYCAAKGSTFSEIFKTDSLKSIQNTIRHWYSLNLKWHTDEVQLFRYVKKWHDSENRCYLLGHNSRPFRIDRCEKWDFDERMVKFNYYRDMHCKRPWKEHKDEMLPILAQLPTPLYEDKERTE